MGDERWASAKLPRIHAELEWEMERSRDSERQHERCLAWCVSVNLSNDLAIEAGNWAAEDDSRGRFTTLSLKLDSWQGSWSMVSINYKLTS